MEPNPERVKVDSADGLVADAMDRVLAAERDAQQAIADCQRNCNELLERARQQRRAVLERAQARIAALRIRSTQALERRVAELMQQRRQAAAAAARQQSTLARRQVALERLVAHLTGPVSDEPGDGP